jgi:hypothetical protein
MVHPPDVHGKYLPRGVRGGTSSSATSDMAGDSGTRGGIGDMMPPRSPASESARLLGVPTAIRDSGAGRESRAMLRVGSRGGSGADVPSSVGSCPTEWGVRLSAAAPEVVGRTGVAREPAEEVLLAGAGARL